jgi:hypothetical protein
MKSIKLLCALVALSMFFGWTVSVWAGRADCGDLPNDPPKPAVKVDTDDPDAQNDYTEMVAETSGATYLTVVNGDQPTPNACGLNPSNDAAEWTGWGGPLDGDNVTIGEGGGSRNEIVIGGVYFERGIGNHSPGKFVYDLTGGEYTMFHGYVGMADEKDPAECGHGGSGDFMFYVDGAEVFRSDVLQGTVDGANVAPVEVELDIKGASELVIEIGDGGDGNGCDHSAIGDAKLLIGAAVKSTGKLSTSWGAIKASY